jgi:hypothetical protein
LIVSDFGRFLWGRGCPGGNPTIPEVSLQSVEWFRRSGVVKFWVVFVLFARSSCLEFFVGYRWLDRP